MEKKEIITLVKNLKIKDHVAFFYSTLEEKHQILFTYLKAGLEKGEAGAYVASEETPEQIRQAMKKFGIKVDRYEEEGALMIIDYRDWYVIDGRFRALTTIDLWKNLSKKSEANGFKALRVTGEMEFFFKERLVKELLDYEQLLHRVLDFPMTVICAFNHETVMKEGSLDATRIMFDLLKSHGAYHILD
nr:MEDS domain-containing protein [Candidatus Njordarchaeum guaymaensis]